MEEAPILTEAGNHRRIRIASSSEFVMSLRAYIDAVKSTCQLCIHDDRNQSSREEDMAKNKNPNVNRLSFSLNINHLLN
jgi:riboflavin biosynthesis pyrimidine reductase